MRRNSLQIHPLAGAIGAEISGIDLAGEIDDDAIAAVRRAWLEHLVIFFPRAKLAARHGSSPSPGASAASPSSTRSSRGSTAFP